MGDMADLVNDDTPDDEWSEGYDDNGYNGTVKCQYCHRGGLHWDKTIEGEWRLHTPTAKVHLCKAYEEDIHGKV